MFPEKYAKSLETGATASSAGGLAGEVLSVVEIPTCPA